MTEFAFKPDPKPGKRPRGRVFRKVNVRAGTAKLQAEGRCRICPTTRNLERHHLVPRSLGGDDVDGNIVPLCHDCHMGYEHGSKRRRFGAKIRRALLAEEIDYCITKRGREFLDRYYPKKEGHQ